MKRRKRLCACVLLGAAFGVFAQSQGENTIARLLSGYLSNDRELQNLSLSAQKAALSAQITEINNGFSVTLSTGTMSATVANGGASFSVNPSASATLPAAKNLTFSASTNLSLSNIEKTMKDTALKLSADIISPKETKREVTLKQSSHEVLAAKRKVQQRALTVEKAFYSELKLLYENAQSVFSARTSLYDDTIKFEEIKAKGYVSTSSTYQTAQMKVKSDERSVASANRVFAHNLGVFYRKCGATAPEANAEKPLESLPEINAAESFARFAEFPKESYTQIADALWTHQINSLSRSGNGSLSLSANGGYTFKNSRTNSDSVEAGLSANLGGLELSTGVSVPVQSEPKPTFTLSATFSPNTQRTSKLEKRQDEITNQQELLAIDSAYEDYESKRVEYDDNLDNLLWQRETATENYDMYAALEGDLLKWYNAGYIKRSEYLSAKNNRDLCEVKLIISEIELIMYNNTVKLLFYNDSELD